jgi:hypothetical protein
MLVDVRRLDEARDQFLALTRLGPRDTAASQMVGGDSRGTSEARRGGRLLSAIACLERRGCQLALQLGIRPRAARPPRRSPALPASCHRAEPHRHGCQTNVGGGKTRTVTMPNHRRSPFRANDCSGTSQIITPFPFSAPGLVFSDGTIENRMDGVKLPQIRVRPRC